MIRFFMSIWNWILTYIFRRKPKYKLSIVFLDSTGKPLVRKANVPVQITDTGSVSATVEMTSAAGNPTPLDPSKPAPVWTADDTNALDVQAQADGSVIFKAKGPLSASDAVHVAYAGLTASDAITVVAGPATTLVIKFGTPS